MASPVTKYTAMTATLAQRLRSTGSDTSITYTVSSSDPWASVVSGVMKTNEGSSSEWIAFTGVTVNSTTSITLTGCSRGLDKDATSLTDTTTTNKKDHGIGTGAYLVLHSATVNKFPELDADNTFTGTITFSGTTGTPKLKVPVYTTTQRDALTSPASGHLIYNSTAGTLQVYSSGSWYDLSSGTTTIPLATNLIAGRVFLDIAATDAATPTVIGANSTRALGTNSGSTANTLSLGSVVPASQSTALNLVGDATYTAGGLRLIRDGTSGGANAVSQILHRGTGSFSITSTENADFLFDSTGRFRSFRDPVYSGTAGETLAAGDWVYKKQSDGKLYKADNTTVEKATVIGVIITGGATDATVYVQRGGTWITTGLTAGSTYYLSGTPGALTATAPSRASSSIIPVIIGVAGTTTALELAIRRQQRRILFSGQRTQAASSGSQTITIGFVCEAVHIGAANVQGLTGKMVGSWGVSDLIAGTNYTYNSSSFAVYLLESDGGGGTATATIAVSGTDIVITWTMTSYTVAGDNIDYVGIAYERI